MRGSSTSVGIGGLYSGRGVDREPEIGVFLSDTAMRLFLLITILLAIPGGSADPFAGLRQEWARDLHAKQIEASVALYTADSDFISDAGRTHGTAAIRELYRKITSTFDSDITFTSRQVEVSGDLAYDSGSYTETLLVRATGKTQHMAGDYVTVYRRGKDGTWRIVEQVWTGGEVQ
jgi:ketosteroid isomerase-like protein